MKKTRYKWNCLAWLLVLSLLGGSVLPSVGTSAAKKSKPKLNKKKVTIRVGKTVKLKVKKKPKKKKVKWSSNKKRVATVNKKGLVKGKKKGTAKITAKVGKKKLTCKVIVKARKTANPEETVNPTGIVPPASTGSVPVSTATATVSLKPTPTKPAAGQETPSASSFPSGQTTEPIQETEEPTDTLPPVPTTPLQSTPKSDYVVQEPEIPLTPPPVVTPEPTPVYQVTIQVQKDGVAWTDSGKAFYLKKEGKEEYTDSFSAENGTYRIYERGSAGDIDTGVDATVNGADISVTVEYFTVTFMKDEVTEMTVPAKTVVLKGSKVEEPTGYDFYAGHTLKGWVTAHNGSTVFDFVGSTIEAKTEIYAEWKTAATTQTSYTIKYFLEDLLGNYREAEDMREENIEGDTNEAVKAPKGIEGFGYNANHNEGTSTATKPVAGGTTVVSYYYQRNSYTITWNAGAGKFSDGSTQKTVTTKFGRPIDVPTFQTGYSCDGWNPPLPVAMPAKNVTYTAKCSPTSYRISYGLKRNDEVENKTYESWPQSTWSQIKETYTIEDEAFTLPQPEKVGYTFAGWTGSNGTTPQKEVTIPKGSTGDRNFVPVWTARTDTVYYVEHYKENLVSGTYTLVEREQMQGTTSAQITPQVKSYEGFTSPARMTDIVRVDTTFVKYYYARNVYELTWDAAGGEIDGAKTKSERKRYEADITAPTAVTRQGYSFTGWSPTPVDKMPAGNVTYRAQWKAAEYTVTLSLKLDNQAWTAAEASQNKKTFALYSGTTKIADFQITAGEYRATLKSSGTYQLYEGTKKTNISVTVNGQNVTQEAKYWTVSFYDNDNQSERIGQQYVLNGEPPKEPEIVKTGYQVQNWYRNKQGDFYSFDMEIPVTAAISLYAKFTPQVYCLDFDLGMAMDSSYEQELKKLGINYDEVFYYNYGTDATILPHPKRSNYTFMGWTGSNGSTPELNVNIKDTEILKKGIVNEDDEIHFYYTANWKSNITCTDAFIEPKQDILTVKNKRIALTMPVNQLVDSRWSGDQVREGITPQGFTSYIYYDNDYRNYFVVYLSENKVVGMATMSRDFTYQYTNNATVSYGSTVPSGFQSMAKKYNYSGGYYYDAGDAYVMVHTDQVSSSQGRIYALQVFAKTVTVNGVTKTLSLDDLIKVENLTAGYQNADVCKSQAAELMDWANAYRVAAGKSGFGTWVNSSQNSAQQACNLLSGNGTASSGTSSSLLDRYEEMYGIMSPSWMMQVDGSRSPDAFGFLTWWLDSSSTTNVNLYTALTKTPEINEYYACAGYAYKDNMSYAVLHFVHP